MDAVSDPAVLEVVCMKSAQTGWTEILNNVVGFHVDQDPAPILVVQPTLEMAEAWSKDRLAPMVRDTPALHGKIADPKARDSGNTLLHKSFTGGRLTIGGANSPSGLASRPIRVVLFDEVDRFPTSAGTEGDPISLGVKRTRTFWNRKILMGSTPTIKGASRIEVAFEQSDQRFYFVPCPHCGEFQRLIWAQVRWEDGKPESAAYVCEHCAAILTDADKPVMLAQGEWRSTKLSTGIAGFHISELYSPWSSWPEMAVGFLRAKKLPETLQAWINTSLGECWEDSGEKLEGSALAARVEGYVADHVPAGVRAITAGTDVQDDRLEVTFWGWGEDEEAWRLGHHVLRGDPGQDQLWTEHDALLRRRFLTDDGRQLVVEACCVDSGGHFTQQVYAYCAARKRFRVWAVKGQGGQGRLIWPKRASRAGRTRANLWIVGVDTAKDVLHGRLKKVTEPGPGYVHFDADTDKDYLGQLTNEVVISKMHQGRRVRVWKLRAAGARVEALDCLVYAYAALHSRGGADFLRARSRHMPAPPAAPAGGSDVIEPEVPAPTPQPIRQPTQQGWVQRRRGSWIRR